jgi:hypothetical protein
MHGGKTMFWFEGIQEHYQLFQEANKIITNNLTSNANLTKEQAMRLDSIGFALAQEGVSDPGRKTYFLLLREAADKTSNYENRQIYQKLQNIFCENCPPGIDFELPSKKSRPFIAVGR